MSRRALLRGVLAAVVAFQLPAVQAPAAPLTPAWRWVAVGDGLEVFLTAPATVTRSGEVVTAGTLRARAGEVTMAAGRSLTVRRAGG